MLILVENVGKNAKGRISKRVFQENKARQIFRKTNIYYPLIRTRKYAYQGVRNVCFLENLACFVFFLPPFWDSPFGRITDESLKSKRTISETSHYILILNFFDAKRWYLEWSNFLLLFFSHFFIFREFVNLILICRYTIDNVVM